MSLLSYGALLYGVWFGIRVCVFAIVYMSVCALFVVDCAMLCGSVFVLCVFAVVI